MSFSCQVLANYLIKYLIAVSWWSNEGAARRCCSSPRAAVLGSAKKPSIHLPPPPPPRSALPGQRRGGCRRSLRLCRPRSALLASLWGCPPPAACFPGAPAGTGGSGRRGGGRRAQRRAVGTRGAACVAMGVSRPEDPRPHALRCGAAPGPRESLFPPPCSGAGAAERLSGASGGGGSRAEPRLGKRPLGAGTVRG